MNILMLNGSPRLHGNTKTALSEIYKSIELNIKNANVELIDITLKKLSGCINCDGCKKNGGTCVIDDDCVPLVEKIYKADAVIFGSPVYFWGITAQLKMLIDKMYSKSRHFAKQHKKIGVVAVGGATLDDREYSLIEDQFKCICDYLNWKLSFYMPVSAYEAGYIKHNEDVMKKISQLWEKL